MHSGGYWELAGILQPICLVLATLAVGAVVIHQSLSLRITGDLVVTQSTASIYRLVRQATIRSSLAWTFGLLVLPIMAYELQQQIPWLLPILRFACSRDWTSYGPVIASWVILTLLLAAVTQAQALGYRHRPYTWHLGWYTLLTVFIFVIWIGTALSNTWNGINYAQITCSLLMLTMAAVLWHRTRRPPPGFSEKISS